MSVPHENRRTFLKQSAAGLSVGGGLSWLNSLPLVSAEDASLKQSVVRVADDLEPLVRLIEETDRGQLLPTIAQKIKHGTSYREVLGALLLAGIRNVQPRPSVGFKFHCVLVVNSCHLASVSGSPEDRWLPIFWALDYFKSSQADERRSSGWRMPPVNESLVPDAKRSRTLFIDAMEKWDVEQADTATAGLVRTAGATEVFNLFAKFAARDYRSIGHKAIFLANAWRTLQVIGWEYAEPVMRSLAFALLNHSGDPNPAENDLSVDRPWREHERVFDKIPAHWLDGKIDDGLPPKLFEVFRGDSPGASTALVADALAHGVSPQSIWDGVLVGAGELLMRQPGIIGLHGMTTANAMHYLYTQVADERLRQRLLLQAAAFNPLFRESAARRGGLNKNLIDRFVPEPIDDVGGQDDSPSNTRDEALTKIIAEISRDKQSAARQLFGFLQSGGSGHRFVDATRRVLFTKGRNAHDYKFSSAVMEDYRHVSPVWRNQYLATSVFNLRGSGDRDNRLNDRMDAWFG